MADGKITIETGIDSSGIKKGINEINKELGKTGKEVAKATKSINIKLNSDEFKKQAMEMMLAVDDIGVAADKLQQQLGKFTVKNIEREMKILSNTKEFKRLKLNKENKIKFDEPEPLESLYKKEEKIDIGNELNDKVLEDYNELIEQYDSLNRKFYQAEIEGNRLLSKARELEPNDDNYDEYESEGNRLIKESEDILDRIRDVENKIKEYDSKIINESLGNKLIQSDDYGFISKINPEAPKQEIKEEKVVVELEDIKLENIDQNVKEELKKDIEDIVPEITPKINDSELQEEFLTLEPVTVETNLDVKGDKIKNEVKAIVDVEDLRKGTKVIELKLEDAEPKIDVDIDKEDLRKEAELVEETFENINPKVNVGGKGSQGTGGNGFFGGAAFGGLMSSAKGVMGALGIAYTVREAGQALLRFGKDSIQASNDYNNAMLGMKRITEGQGKDFGRAKKFLDEYVSDGLVTAAEAAEAYKNLSMADYSTEQTEKILTAFKDSAAFGRQAHLTMGEAIKGATEGLKNEHSILVDNVGVTKNLSVMWEEYAKSIGKTVGNLTAAEKRQAAFEGILRETRFQIGDAIVLSNTYSGQMAQLAFNIDVLQRTVGDGFKAVLGSAIMPVINDAIVGLTKLAAVFKAVMEELFGKDIDLTGVSKAAQAEKALGKEIDKTSDKMKKSLAGFDELNILSENVASNLDGSGVDLGIDGTSAEDILSEDEMNAVNKAASKLVDKLKEFDPETQDLKDAFGSLGDTFGELWDNLTSGDSDNWFTTLISDLTNNRIKGTMIQAEGLVKGLDGLLMILNGDFIGGAARMFDGMTDIIEGHVTKYFGEEIGKYFSEEYWGNKWESFWKAWGNGWDLIQIWWDEDVAPWFTKDKWSEEWKKAKEGWTEGFNNIRDGWNNSVGLWWSENVAPWFTKEKWKIEWDKTRAGWAEGIDKLKETWGVKAGEWWVNVTSWFNKEKWSAEWNTAKEGWKTGIDNLKNSWNTSISEWWSNKVEPWFKKDRWINAMSGVKEGFKEAFRSALNNVIDQFNKFIDWVNDKMSFSWKEAKIPGTDIGIDAGSIQLFNLSRIPRLAKGAVIPPNAERLAIIGDQKYGLNVETPLATMIDAFNTALDSRSDNAETNRLLRQILNATSDGKILMVDRKVLAKVVNKAQAENFRDTGMTNIPV